MTFFFRVGTHILEFKNNARVHFGTKGVGEKNELFCVEYVQ
jgi:hypothetical protein